MYRYQRGCRGNCSRDRTRTYNLPVQRCRSQVVSDQRQIACASCSSSSWCSSSLRVSGCRSPSLTMGRMWAVNRPGRPETPPGTYGKIRTYRAGNRVRAMTLYRDFDGSTVQVERWGASVAAAERKLEEALRDRLAQAGGGDEITRESRVQDLAEHWWGEFSKLGRSPGTLRLYRDRLDNQVIPGVGKLRVRELTTAAINRHVKSVAERNGAAVAKVVRTVLSNMCGHACRLDAMTANPCRDVSPVKPKVRNPPRALTAAEVNQLRASLTYDDAGLRQELPDIVDAMLATTLRIAEVLAMQWPDLDLEAGTVETGNVVVRVKGKGLQIKSDQNSKINARTLLLPRWGVELFKRRWENRVVPNCDYDPVFMSSVRTLKDPENAHTQLRKAFDLMGYGWLVPHHLRKTGATTMDKEGLTAREIADQLGHAKTSMTLDSYMGRKIMNPRAAAALEILAPENWSSR